LKAHKALLTVHRCRPGLHLHRVPPAGSNERIIPRYAAWRTAPTGPEDIQKICRYVLTSSEDERTACSQTSITGSGRKIEESLSQGWPFPPTSADFDPGKAESPEHQLRYYFRAAAVRLLVSTEVREGQRLVAYQFVTRCANCAKQFGILWVMDSARVACAVSTSRREMADYRFVSVFGT
jgi:hypothetical protein